MTTTPSGLIREPSGLVRLSRRRFLAASLVSGVALSACTRSTPRPSEAASADAIAAAEAARPRTGKVVSANLTAASADIDLGGKGARALAYNNQIPGPLIRATVGDELEINVTNNLQYPTSVHSHGLALRNDMDGASPATPNIKPGDRFTYRFTSPYPGTYWAHPHTGLEADEGLYVPMIIDDPAEPGRYDAEWIVILDDWTAGVGSSPQQLFGGLQSMGAHGRGPSMPGMPSRGNSANEERPPVPGVGGVGISDLLGGDAGDINYPYYLINGRIPAAATTFTAKPGQRVRIRIINAGSDTAFRVALAGHRMTITHTDGFSVLPNEVDAILVGMGERYDVVITAQDGIFPLVAAAEGKNAQARALLTTGAGSIPNPDFHPPELNGHVGTVHTLTAAPEVSLDFTDIHRTLTAQLSGTMMHYNWTINGLPSWESVPMTVQRGQNATLTFINNTTMWHPMHLHGHTFQVITPDGRPGPRKDTVIVLPKTAVTVLLVADNPGIWMLHCHNTYHQEAGMMTSLEYQS